jgi:hypothetical protein
MYIRTIHQDFTRLKQIMILIQLISQIHDLELSLESL